MNVKGGSEVVDIVAIVPLCSTFARKLQLGPLMFVIADGGMFADVIEHVDKCDPAAL